MTLSLTFCLCVCVFRSTRWLCDWDPIWLQIKAVKFTILRWGAHMPGKHSAEHHLDLWWLLIILCLSKKNVDFKTSFGDSGPNWRCSELKACGVCLFALWSWMILEIVWLIRRSYYLVRNMIYSFHLTHDKCHRLELKTGLKALWT